MAAAKRHDQSYASSRLMQDLTIVTYMQQRQRQAIESSQLKA
jgi:hypothetical protein